MIILCSVIWSVGRRMDKVVILMMSCFLMTMMMWMTLQPIDGHLLFVLRFYTCGLCQMMDDAVQFFIIALYFCVILFLFLSLPRLTKLLVIIKRKLMYGHTT